MATLARITYDLCETLVGNCNSRAFLTGMRLMPALGQISDSIPHCWRLHGLHSRLENTPPLYLSIFGKSSVCSATDFVGLKLHIHMILSRLYLRLSIVPSYESPSLS